jgi:hypothetical protein
MSGRLFPGAEIPQAIDGPADDFFPEFSTINSQPSEPSLWLVMTEADAKKIVAATENGAAYQVIEILKRQPWWREVCAQVRKLRHLKPEPAVAAGSVAPYPQRSFSVPGSCRCTCQSR